jgi:Phage integrase, N-terminal SAM-like domain
LVDRWLPTKQAQVPLSTFDSYRRNIDKHVIPALRPMPLQCLTPDDLDGFYAALLRSGKRRRAGAERSGRPNPIARLLARLLGRCKILLTKRTLEGVQGEVGQWQ